MPDVKFIPRSVPVNAAKSSDTAIFCGVTGNKSIIVLINQIKKTVFTEIGIFKNLTTLKYKKKSNI